MAASMATASLGVVRFSKLNNVLGAFRHLQLSVFGSHNGLVQPGVQAGVQHRSFLWKKSSNDARSPKDVLASEHVRETTPVNQKPKFPSNAFSVYFQKVTEQIRRENPGILQKDIMGKASVMWKKLDPKEKERLVAERRELYLKYKEAVKEYNENMTPEQIREETRQRRKKENVALKKARIALGMPKKTPSGYVEFIRERTGSGAGGQEKIDFTQAISAWRNLDETTKEKYHKIHKQNLEQYKVAMEKWESEMVAQGRYDLLRKGTLEKLRQRNVREEDQQKKSSRGNSGKSTKRKEKVV